MRAMMEGWLYEWVKVETTMLGLAAAMLRTWLSSHWPDWVPVVER
jgi:hypothetical protein